MCCTPWQSEESYCFHVARRLHCINHRSNSAVACIFKVVFSNTISIVLRRRASECSCLINVIVVREVRRASNNAAVNLGLQHHQQSTSSNSAVPTAMLVTTSLLYVLINGTVHVVCIIASWMPAAAFSPVTWDILRKVLFLLCGVQFRLLLQYSS